MLPAIIVDVGSETGNSKLMIDAKEICRLANRVELSAYFAGSAGIQKASHNSFREAISTSLVLLGQIDPHWLKDTFVAAESDFAKSQERLATSEGWTEFLTTHSDLMHQIAIHQKAIERLGTETSTWDQVVPTYQELADSLESLSGLLGGTEADLLGAFFPTQTSTAKIFNLSSTFYGLALMANANQAAKPNWSAAICCSGAWMVVANVAELK
jgi:hypothetical protein